MKTFSDKVRDIVRKIPKGKTMTYKAVAAKAGNPKAARAVGAIMRTNYDPSIPCPPLAGKLRRPRGKARYVTFFRDTAVKLPVKRIIVGPADGADERSRALSRRLQ